MDIWIPRRNDRVNRKSEDNPGDNGSVDIPVGICYLQMLGNPTWLASPLRTERQGPGRPEMDWRSKSGERAGTDGYLDPETK
jgi:hypothetical protein